MGNPLTFTTESPNFFGTFSFLSEMNYLVYAVYIYTITADYIQGTRT